MPTSYRRTTSIWVLIGSVLWPTAHAVGQKPGLCAGMMIGNRQSTQTPISGFHGRLADPRVNFFMGGVGAKYICRWAFERRDPTAQSSDVLNPVTYVIDVPPRWTPVFIRAVNAWLPVFDAIGFRHALIARTKASFTEQGTPIPTVHVVTVRIRPDSDIGGFTACKTGASGVGDLTSCRIDINAGMVQTAGAQLCAVSVGGDPSIPLPCSDSVLGLMVQGVVTHEVGHSLGLDHNYYGPVTYPTDSLRSTAFVHRRSWSPSIMSHLVYDNVVQPTDHIPLPERWLTIGPEDYWAIAWGYRPLPAAATPEAEVPTLEQWRRAQDTAAYLRLAVPDTSGTVNEQAWGGTAPVRATDLWMQNLARVQQRLNSGTTASPASVLSDWWQWAQMRLTELLGGVVAQAPYPKDLKTVRRVPVDTATQLQAFRTVLASALYGQDPLFRILRGNPRENTDSVPILFDPAADRSAVTASWQVAQFAVLSQLVTRVPLMPHLTWPMACRDLAQAVRHLTPFVSQGPQSQQDAARQLRDLVGDAFTSPGVCH